MIVLDALCADIKGQVEADGPFDALVFTGDLVIAGCHEADFDDAMQQLFRLADAAAIERSKVFVAPGNHDICRNKVREYSILETGLADRLIDTEEMNTFLDSLNRGDGQAQLAVSRLDEFSGMVRKFLPHQKMLDQLAYTAEIEHDGKTIALAILNSAWRATGEADDVDKGRLCVGERQVDAAIRAMSDMPVLRIALLHHPLEWLAPFDRASIEPLLIGSFDLICTGHMHEMKPQTVASISGTSIFSQSGSMYAGRKWYNGYQAINIDLLSGRFEFHLREYDDRNRKFGPSIQSNDGIFVLDNPKSGDRTTTAQTELFLRQYRNTLRERAREHLNFAGQSNEYINRVLDRFVPPPLYERILPDPTVGDEQIANLEEIEVDSLVNDVDDLIIIGDRKSGRTSLAFHIALELASGRYKNTSIPVFLDIRNHKFEYYELRREVLSFYGPPPTGFELEKSFGDGLYTFIVDNFDVYDEKLLKEFREYTSKFEKCRWIVIASPTNENVIRDRLLSELLPTFRRIRIAELNRRSIRKLANTWADENSEEPDEVFNRVISQIRRDGLPKTGYIVSLVLWALEQQKQGEKLNESLLLQNVIDHLVGRANFRLSGRSSFNPTAKMLTLQQIAVETRSNGGFSQENDILQSLAVFFQAKKLPYVASDVIEKLIECGVLHRVNDLISFKYKSFEEYFSALRFQANPEELREALSGLEFLRYRRELELLSGLRQKNDDIITAISHVLQSRAPERFAETSASTVEKATSNGISAGTTKAQLNEIRRTRLTHEQVDQIMDEADRRAVSRGDRPLSESLRESDGDIYKAALAREAEAITADSKNGLEPLRPATHMASIDILARVVRNSDFSDFEVKGPAIALVLDSWVRILGLMLEEIRAVVSNIEWEGHRKINDSELEIVNYLVARMLMSIIAETIIDQMSSPILAESISEVGNDPERCASEKALALFLLEDSSYSDWQEQWSELIADKKSPGFVLDAITDRLGWIVSRRALDADQSARVNKVVDAIEKRLEHSGRHKSDVLQSIRTVAQVESLRAKEPVPKRKRMRKKR